MPSKFFSLVTVVSILALVACAQPETDTAPPAAAEVEEDVAPIEADLDPTVVDADHYTAEFENERAQMHRTDLGPGAATTIHHHPESVAVFLTDGQVQMTLPDGSVEEMEVTAGTAAYSGYVEHDPKNTADVPLEVVEIEVKSDASSSGEASRPDATVADAEDHGGVAGDRCERAVAVEAERGGRRSVVGEVAFVRERFAGRDAEVDPRCCQSGRQRERLIVRAVVAAR